MKKVLSVLLVTVILLLAAFPATAAEPAKSDDIVILYTNDIHSYIDGKLSYDVVAAIKKDLQTQYNHVLLVDAGDHVQGSAYGSMDKGASVIALMNAAGYDAATLGNHEFDYGMAGCMNVIEWADYPYLSANFYREENGVRKENVLDSYVLFDCGAEKVAFVGITTPETFSKSTPIYFQDAEGNFIYGISGALDPADMHADVQSAINAAVGAGATQVIALGHLGVDPSSGSLMSDQTIAALQGLDAFIDGHSHTVMEATMVKDKAGQDVLLTQTGEYFGHIGMMVIDSESGEITTDLISCETILADDGKTVLGYELKSDLYSGTELISDAGVYAVLSGWMAEIDSLLGQKIGYTELTFDNYDADGNRLVRAAETNSGDFSADALYYLFDSMGLDVDVAVMNGGGVRNQSVTGDITYKTCKNMHTFGNVACLQTVTGQQLLDALEWGVRFIGQGESGSFLHVSGITYQIDRDQPSMVEADEFDSWVRSPEAYRVHSVKVYNKSTGAWDALQLDAKYNLAGYNYMLRDMGAGFTMFTGTENVLDYVMEDYMVLANYVMSFENGEIKASNSPLLEKYPNMLIDYTEVTGSGRIIEAPKPAETPNENPNGNPNENTGENTGDVTDTTPSGDSNGGADQSQPKTVVVVTVAVCGAALLAGCGVGVFFYLRKKKRV